jgi:formate dehydrogenase assembly factor FdhD
MCPVIDNPVSCETCAFICFLHAKNMSAAGIHSELCAAYSQNVLSEETVRHWCRMFKDGKQMIMMKSDVVGRHNTS